MYWLDPDAGNSSNAFLAYCDMTLYNGETQKWSDVQPWFPLWSGRVQNKLQQYSCKLNIPQTKMTPSTKRLQLKSSSFLCTVKFVNCTLFVPDFAVQSGNRFDKTFVKILSHRVVLITAYCILKPWSQFSQQFDANVVIVVFVCRSNKKMIRIDLGSLLSSVFLELGSPSANVFELTLLFGLVSSRGHL